MSKGAAQAAYVLHQWPWSESSLILDLFTREQGRVAVVAKGAKRPYSQLRSVLLPFQRVHVVFGRQKSAVEGDSEVQTLRTAEFAGGASPLPSERLMTGFYLNELLQKLLARQDPHERLFDAYGDALRALAQASADTEAEAVLRAFELRLLRETGVLPDLGRDTVTQQAVQSAQRYWLRADAGLVAATGDAPALAGDHWLALQAALDVDGGDDGSQLRDCCAALLPALRPQLRALLHYHLGAAPLRTRQVMQGVRRLLDATPAAGTP